MPQPSPTTDTWTPERVATLTRMWNDGALARDIAAAIGPDITKMAVIGKAHRLKLPPRDARAFSPRGPRTKRSPDQVKDDSRVRSTLIAKARSGRGNPGHSKAAVMVRRAESRPEPIPEFIPDDGVDFTDRVGLLDLGRDDCRWIEGDPKAQHTFCGKPVKPGTSWCEFHYARVYSAR